MSEIDTIRAMLARSVLPDWVQSVSAELMTDHAGEPGVDVTLVVRGDRDDIFNNGGALLELDRQILESFVAAGIERWPYTRYLSANEAA